MNRSRKPKLWIWLSLIVPILALSCTISIPSGDLDQPGAGTDREQPRQEQAEPRVNEPAGAQAELLPTPTSGPTPTALPVPEEITSEEQLLTNLYARVHPSVVFITIFGEVGTGSVTALGQGSGFVYDDAGHIVTNAHVVQGASQVEVTFYDDTVRVAEVVGVDLYSDLAVIRVELPAGISPLPLADMNSLAVGQTVIAVGNPFGLEGTMTRGIISALGRSIPALSASFSIPQAIQTDAAINPGNSGGPLLNLNGEVIGVNAQIRTESGANSGVGFAIPVSIVKEVVPDLIENGEHAWTWLGIRSTTGSLSPLIVEAMDLPVERGVFVAEVEPGGPADKAGLRGLTGSDVVRGREVPVGGDVITAIDGQPVNTFEDLLTYLALQTEPGQQVTLTIIRDGQAMDVPVTLEERPASLGEEEFTIPGFP